MAKAESSKTHVTQAFDGPQFRPRWVPATIYLLVGTLLSVALAHFSPEQTTIRTTNPTETNLVGWVGADSAFWLFFTLGAGAWLVAFFLFWLFYINMKGIRRLASARLIGMFFCIVSACGLLSMQDFAFTDANIYASGPGGELGRIVFTTVLRDAMGVFGAGLLQATVLVLSLVFVLTRDLGAWFDRAFAWVFNLRERWRRRRAAMQKDRSMKNEARAKLREQASAELRKQVANLGAAPDARRFTLPKSDQSLPVPPPKTQKTLSLRGIGTSPSGPAQQPPPPVARGPALRIETVPASAPEPEPTATASKLNLKIVTPEATRKAEMRTPRDGDDYIFPPLDILRDASKTDPEMDESEHAQNAETLLRTLSEFGVEVSLGEIHIGPVITRYEVMPAPGVRVEKIAGLDKNIALGMRAQSVRILAPVPGKGVVGVEVPNKNATAVGLREILESADWVESKAELPIVIGKDVSGAPIVADLTRMPHLLIAGATGSGKSVCINSIIASLVYHTGPRKVRMLMIDPKIVELKIFNSLPHMMIPVVTEPKKVPGALKWLLSEMEKRYRIFAKVGVRNVSAFNARNSAENHVVPDDEADVHLVPEVVAVPRDEELVVPDHLPYIVCLIDELADLMMVAPAEVETSIARIAQLARAAGIHLIIATQRPSVNVITGVIKANLPSRIAFQVASKVDSRTILDTGGADQLIGRGDMLFSPPGTSRIIRAQGAFVSDDEVSAIIEALKKNGPPTYLQEVQDHVDRDDSAEAEGQGEDDESDDELFPQAIEVLKASRRASTSMLQRRLRIGYNRAARLMELLEARGIVGPENGAQPREILADLDSL
ncbi:MAG TPA: DNA translocase FtsK [Opitutaceae bacterium]